jgi:hypothetical protein
MGGLSAGGFRDGSRLEKRLDAADKSVSATRRVRQRKRMAPMPVQAAMVKLAPNRIGITGGTEMRVYQEE